MAVAIMIIAWGSVLASLFLVADMVAVDLATRRLERIALRRPRAPGRDEPRH